MLSATGAGAPQRWVFPAVDGLPLRLDPAGPVTGVVAMRALELGAGGQKARVGAGVARLDVELSGRVASGRVVTIGTQSIDYTVTPTQEVYPLELRMATAAAARGKTFTALTLTATSRGASLLTGCVELDDPASFVQIPVARA